MGGRRGGGRWSWIESGWGRGASYGLIVMLGSSSWLGVNAMWLELPLLVRALPEGWSLPSFLAIIIQLACIGPVLYSCPPSALHPQAQLTQPWCRVWEMFHSWVLGHRHWLIAGCIAFAAACMVLLALLWDRTAFVAGKDHSVALFAIFFAVSLVCCTSNVLFLPFMGSFR